MSKGVYLPFVLVRTPFFLLRIGVRAVLTCTVLPMLLILGGLYYAAMATIGVPFAFLGGLMENDRHWYSKHQKRVGAFPEDMRDVVSDFTKGFETAYRWWLHGG
jgi:hypothetical protein